MLCYWVLRWCTEMFLSFKIFLKTFVHFLRNKSPLSLILNMPWNISLRGFIFGWPVVGQFAFHIVNGIPNTIVSSTDCSFLFDTVSPSQTCGLKCVFFICFLPLLYFRAIVFFVCLFLHSVPVLIRRALVSWRPPFLLRWNLPTQFWVPSSFFVIKHSRSPFLESLLSCQPRGVTPSPSSMLTELPLSFHYPTCLGCALHL